MYGIAFAIIVINLYSVLGGFRGIISIDIFQFLIFFAIIPFSFVMTINDSNFSGYFIDSLPSSSFKIELTLPIAIGLVTVSLLPEISAPFTQRYLTLAHDVSALKEVFKKLFMVAVPFMISICLITYLIKLNSLSDGLSTNILLGYVKSLSPGLKGLMIAGLFAILMSTADSYMNATTAVISNDFIKKSFPMIGAKKLLLITRGVMLLLSCFPFILAIYKDQLFKFMLIFRSFGTIMLIVPLSLALFNFYITKWQFKFSIFFGIAFMVVNFIINDHYQFTSAIACILGNIVGLLLHKNAYVKLDKKITGLFFIIFAGIKKFFFFILELRCSTINKLNKKIKEHSTISEYFGLFIMSYYLIFSFFIESNKNMLPHLIVAGYICSLLLFVLKGVLLSEKSIEKYGYILHFVCVTLCLPIISSYLLFYYVGNNQTSYFWIVNALLTTVLLYQFLGSFAFLLSMTIGFICGAVIYMIEFQTINMLHALSILGYVYFSFIFISQVIARGREVKAAEKEKLYSQKSEVMKLFTELLSHELNHPAIVTHSVADTCQEILKAIKEGKRQPNEENIELVEEYIITGNLYKRFETMAKN